MADNKKQTNENIQQIEKLREANKLNLAESASSAQETDWNSKDFKAKVVGYKKYAAPSGPSLVGHCQRFWTWYAGLDRAPQDLDLMVCGILSSVSVGGTVILHEDLIGEEPSTSEDVSKEVVKEYKFFKVGSALASTKNFVAGKSSISVDHCIQWVNSILEALRVPNLDTDAKYATSRTNLVRLTALVLLNCCRLATKDQQSVQEHIVSTVNDRAASLFSIQMSTYSTCAVFAPPCHDFVITFTELIRKGGEVSKMVLGRIIYSYVYAKDDLETVRSVYRTGCLLSLSYTGLSPVAWLIKAAKAKKLEQLDLLVRVYIPMMESFITKYLKLSQQPDASWVFCRLVSDTALLSLSANSEPLATAVFVAMCYNPKNPDMTVWAIPSLACISYEDIIRGHCIAEAMMDTSACLSTEVALVDEAKPLVAKLETGAEGCYQKYYDKFGALFNITTSERQTNQVDPDEDEDDDGAPPTGGDAGTQTGGSTSTAAGATGASSYAGRFQE